MAMINSTIADALFGSKNTISSGSFFSASTLGDWGMMKNGAYGKLMKSYYTKANDTTKTNSTTSTDLTKKWNEDYKTELNSKLGSLENSTTNNALSSIKSTAKAMETAADDLTSMDFEKSTRDELYTSAKKLVDSYNAALESSSKTDLASISQSVTWMTNATKTHSSQLEDLGITVDTDNKLSIDKDKFNAAELSDIKTLMEGNNSFVASVSQRATGLANLAANQMTLNSGSSLYTSSGLLG